jgi:hypothetical protein
MLDFAVDNATDVASGRERKTEVIALIGMKMEIACR